MTPPDRDLLAAVLTRKTLELDTLLAETARAWQSSGALLMTLVPGGSVLQVAASYPGTPEADRALRLAVGYGVIGLVAANGQGAVLEHDSPRDPVHRRVLGLADG